MTRSSTAPKAAARLSLRIKSFPYHMIPPYSYPLKRPTNTIQKRIYGISAGDYPVDIPYILFWIVPCGYAAKDILTQFGLTELKTFHLSDTKMLEHIFRKMHNALRTDSIFGNYKASGYLYDFLMEFYRLIAYKDPATSVSSALMKALDYINYNYFSPITMDELCSVSGVTKQHLCLLFRKKLSMRPMEYIAKRRIQEAKALLTGTEKSIEQVAEETGFCSESYFCKLFKRYEGMTPSAFRQIK